MRLLPRSARTALALTALIGAPLAVAGASAASAALVTAGTVVSSTAAPSGVAGRVDTYALTVGGRSRSYRLYVPPKLPTTPVRLVVMLHPLGNTAATMETVTGFDAGAAANSALVAYPSGVGDSWNAGTCCGTAVQEGVDDVGFLDAVLDDVAGHYAVDPAKTAMGGFSNGAMMSYRYACERSSRVRVFAVAGGVGVMPACALSRPVALLHMHGLLDNVVPWTGTTLSTLVATGILPSVSSSVSGFAAKDGCTGWAAPTTVSTGATRYTAAGCPAGASVDVLTSPNLAHGWVTGASAATYHLDETGLSWSFFLSH